MERMLDDKPPFSWSEFKEVQRKLEEAAVSAEDVNLEALYMEIVEEHAEALCTLCLAEYGCKASELTIINENTPMGFRSYIRPMNSLELAERGCE